MSNLATGLRHFKRLISLNQELFLVVALATMTLAIALGYLLPKKYEAKTTIFIEQNVITDLVKGIAISPSMQAKIKNLAVSLTSRSLLVQIIKELDKDLGLKSDFDREAYLKDLQRRITVNLNERQAVIVISFWDPDPRFARDFVNTMAQVYIERNTTTKREESKEATSFLAEQIEVFKKRVEAADEAINAYKSEKGLILSSDGTFIRSEIKEADQKLEALSIRRAQLEARRNLLAPSKGNRPSKIEQREAELKQLLSVYTEKHPRVIKARAALQAAKNGQDLPLGRESSTNTTVPTPQLIQLELDSIIAMQEHELKVIENSKITLRELPHVKATLAELMTKREQEANIYNQLVSRYGQSEISKQMELKDKSIIFRIVDPAVIPEIPASPNRPAVILIGIALGVCVGLAATYLAERFNHSIRSLQELKTLGLPLLAVIPKMTSTEETQRKVKRNTLVLALAGGYFALILGVLAMESIKFLGLSPAWLQNVARHIL